MLAIESLKIGIGACFNLATSILSCDSSIAQFAIVEIT
jgi:hypothetical protein